MSRPRCDPLLDPFALTALSAPEGAPSSEICVRGEASYELGSGLTARPVPGSTAERFSCEGTTAAPVGAR